MNSNITNTLKCLCLAFCIFQLSNTKAQATLSKSFDNAIFLPTGWAAVGSNTLWSRRTTGTFPTCTPQSGAGMVRFASRGTAANTALCQTFNCLF